MLAQAAQEAARCRNDRRAHFGSVAVSSSQAEAMTFEMSWPRHVVVPTMADGGVDPLHQ